MVEKICNLCYRREWYTRMGGCTAIRFFIENYPKIFLQKNSMKFLNACLEVFFYLNINKKFIFYNIGNFWIIRRTIMWNNWFRLSNNWHAFENFVSKWQFGQSIHYIFYRAINWLLRRTWPSTERGNLSYFKCKIKLIQCIRIIYFISSNVNIPVSKILHQSKNKLELKLSEGIQRFAILSIPAKISFIVSYLIGF